jgi:hypothetical protein
MGGLGVGVGAGVGVGEGVGVGVGAGAAQPPRIKTTSKIENKHNITLFILDASFLFCLY